MRLAYAGTAPFAALVLSELVARRADVAVVVTRPDRPRGRHGTPQPSPVKQLALLRHLPLLQPGRLAGEHLEEMMRLQPGVLAVCAHGEIIRREVLDRLPVVVTHPSAVPRWRGAAPVERALMAGETEIGVATLLMTSGVDEGPLGDLRTVHVPADADAGKAYELLAPAAAEGLMAVLAAMEDGSIVWCEQRGEPTFAAKLDKAGRSIDWRDPAQRIVDQVRALSPAIGATATIGGRDLIVWRARALPAPPDGDAERLVVAAGEGWVEILELQAPGKRRVTIAEYLRGAGRWLGDR